MGILRPGDEMIYCTGRPYDTLEEVIGIRGEGKGSLKDFMVNYKQVELLPGGEIDLENLGRVISSKTRMVCIQRATGYSWRKAVTIEQIRKTADFVHSIDPSIICMAVQILQIVISVLPGQVFQFAAGFLFGFVPGLVYSIIGAMMGTTITYFLARFLGRDAMHLFFGGEKMQYFIERLNSERAYIIVFLIYLIPGLPKDLVCYAAGVSNMKFKPFLIISTVGRIPAMCGSLLFGVMYMQKSYTGMIIIAAVCTVILIFCFIYRKRLTGILDNIYNKIS